MSAPAWGSTGTLYGANSASPAIAVPASVAANDVIVVAGYIDSTATVTGLGAFQHAANSPRTVAPGAGSGEHSLVVLWKRATGADSGTYAFTLSSSVFMFANAVRYTGVITTGDPWDTTNAAQSGPSNVTTAPAVSLTTLGPDRMLFYVATDFNGDGGTWGAPSGFNLRQGGTNVTTHSIADLVQSAAGSTGSLSGTNTAAGYMGGFVGALIGTTVAGGEANVPQPQMPTQLFIFLGARQQRMYDLRAGVAPTVEQGSAGLALGGTGAAVKVAKQSGTASLGLVGTGAGRKVAPEAGTTPVALVGTGADRKTAVSAGTAEVALRAQGTAVKVAPDAGRALLGLVGTGAESTAATRPQAGSATLGLRAAGTAVKVGTEAGRGSLALDGTGAAVRRAVESATAAVALSGTGAARKTASEAGRALVVLAGTGSGVKVVGTAGRAVLGLVAYEVAAAPLNPPGATFSTGVDRPLLAMLSADRSAGWSSGSTAARLGGSDRSGGPGGGRDRPTT